MYTLQEFMQFTKGWEYVIAIGFIFIFMVFWRLLSESPGSKKKQNRETRGLLSVISSVLPRIK